MTGDPIPKGEDGIWWRIGIAPDASRYGDRKEFRAAISSATSSSSTIRAPATTMTS